MNDPMNQMAAMSAALRMLLADHPLRKPVDLRIAASNAMTPEIISMMMSSVAAGHATFLALFDVGADTAFLNRVMIVEGSTARQQINIGAGKFVRKADGSFAVLSIDRSNPYEYTFSKDGRRLKRQAVPDSKDRGLMELRGMQALVTKAATAACQIEARTASVHQC